MNRAHIEFRTPLRIHAYLAYDMYFIEDSIYIVIEEILVFSSECHRRGYQQTPDSW